MKRQSKYSIGILADRSNVPTKTPSPFRFALPNPHNPPSSRRKASKDAAILPNAKPSRFAHPKSPIYVPDGNAQLKKPNQDRSRGTPIHADHEERENNDGDGNMLLDHETELDFASRQPTLPHSSPPYLDDGAKRRRIAYQTPSNSTAYRLRPAVESEQQSPRAVPKFNLVPSSATQPVAITQSSRPQFKASLKNSSATQSDQASPQQPVPTAFSPRHKKDRFVPDGWASTVRNWIIDASSSTSDTLHAVTAQMNMTIKVPPVLDDEQSIRLRIHQVVVSTDMAVVFGAVVGIGPVHILRVVLAGQGFAPNEGLTASRVPVQTGRIVSLKSPLWDLDLPVVEQQQDQEAYDPTISDSVKWIVCAGWQLL